MTVTADLTQRAAAHGQMALEDRFEVLKEIGDGSFGSVILARVRTAGANVARRGSVVSLLVQWRRLILPGDAHSSHSRSRSNP